MNTFKELDIVALTQDRQTTQFEKEASIILFKRQVGTIVMEYDDQVFEVEFSNSLNFIFSRH
ncbi:DUF4926 domain-containing protein [Okeania sp.]|uniref:DUF4926 domain-containing protein n=1 Tax=Okeania sp. TaxID=3100323 RepID=UPI002B4ADC88|nr:DUF4926 domain-containing protein [Okeania sp.]MEB3341091.1 DUF4926 domain-containing protein [Okeania sp.]